jgi:hypothetical protein
MSVPFFRKSKEKTEHFAVSGFSSHVGAINCTSQGFTMSHNQNHDRNQKKGARERRRQKLLTKHEPSDVVISCSVRCQRCQVAAAPRSGDCKGKDAMNSHESRLGWLEEGRRYGYPDCCILFFHRIWGPLALGTHSITDKIRRNEPCSRDELCLIHVYLEHRRHLDGTGYVPCPGCLAKKLGGPESLPTLFGVPRGCCEGEEG